MSFLQSVVDVNDDVAVGMPVAKESISDLAEYEVNMEPDKLPDAAFALNLITKTGSVIRKYPIKTKDDTSVSRWYFTKVAEKHLPDQVRKVAATFIKVACKAHGIGTTGVIERWADGELEDNAVNLTEIDTSTPAPRPNLSDSDYALIMDTGARKYPINTPKLVKTAATYFRQNWKHIEPSWRNQMADNITKKAADMGIEISVDDAEFLEKYATGRYSNVLNVAISERKNALQNDDMAVRTLDLLFEKRASMQPSRFAQSLETFDRMHGLNDYWDSTIIDPYQSTFGGIPIERPIYVQGHAVYRDKIAALASDEKVLKMHFNPDFVAEFRKNPIETFQTLQSPDQQLMLALMNEKE